jgi:signal transduction histidine kinase
MRFADGIYYISITDNSRTREDMLNRGMAFLVAAVVLLLVLFWYTNHLTVRIIRLSEETATVGAGDLEGTITVDGEDEIAVLAEDIDSMRHAIIEQMLSEKRAWESNSELITAMSHDIRTPMTSLIGYLGLLNRPESLSEEEKKRYLERAYGKSLALKELTDELFKYFLVFGSSGLEFHREDYDAQMLLMQLLSEAEFDLADAGLKVRRIDRLQEGRLINTDAAMLKRVIDNLVSNIKKYAGRERPVTILTEEKDGWIAVAVSNAVAQRVAGTESTKIGLRTCSKILEGLGGSFSTERKGSRFSAGFLLPI